VPLRRMECVLKRENLLTGESKLSRPVFRGISVVQVRQERFPASHCGLLLFRVEQIVVYDLSGLFFRRIVPPEPAVCRMNPRSAPPDPAPAFPDGSEGHGAVSIRRGGGGEDYELREYRPGDALRAIHWKLAAKAEEPIVREALEPKEPRFVLSFDLWGADAELDATFDQLVWLSRRLLESGHPHELHWLDPETGMPEERRIEDKKALQDCLMLLFSAPAPRQREENPSLLAGKRKPDWQYHVLPQNRALEKDGGQL
jgi:hypothetical protein